MICSQIYSNFLKKRIIINILQLVFYKIPIYSSKLAAILKIFQLNLIWSTVQHYKRAKTSDPGAFLRSFREKWLLIKGYTPFNYFLSLKTYAKRYRNNITTIGTIVWGDSMLNLSLKGLKFDIPQFKRFIQTEIGLLRGKLAFLSFLTPQKGNFLSYINLNKLNNNPGNL